MYEHRHTPAVRFTGFTDAWEQRELGEAVDVCSGCDYKKLLEGPIPVYGTGGYMLSVNKALSYTEDAVGIGRKGTIDKPYILRAPFWTVDTLFYALPKTGYDLQFTLGLFQKIDWKKKDESTGVPSLSKQTINETEVTTPTYKEQHKIGNLLQTLDNLITLHQHKLERLQNLKKAMLEKMFPRNGQNEPEVRFTGFTDAWELRKAKDICSISTGKSNTQDSIDEGLYPFYVRSAIIERSNRYLFDEEAVLTVGDGVGTGKVFHYVNGKYDLHQRVYRMFSFTEDVSAKYFYYFFSTHFYARVMSMTAKTSVDSVRLEMIADMDIQHPNKQEQLLISGFFDNLDNLITLHQRKLERMQNMKKAFLDKMFV